MAHTTQYTTDQMKPMLATGAEQIDRYPVSAAVHLLTFTELRRRILGLACTDCDEVATVGRQPAGGTPEGKPGPKCDRYAGPARTTLGQPDEPAHAATLDAPDLLALVDELAARYPDPTSRDQLDRALKAAASQRPTDRTTP